MSGPRDAHAAFERLVRWTITDELPAAAGFLPPEECREFTAYYRDLPAPGDHARIARYLRGTWRAEAGWTARWLAAFAARAGRAPRVLDAGSGFGTYAMMFAAAGAAVTGVDLRPDRLDVAERRRAHCLESAGWDLEARYVRADLTGNWGADYDLVWVYNALSHIDPLEGFLAAVRRHLTPGGVLVVGDINGAHPAHLRRLARVRSEVHQQYVAPDGQRHHYAVERTFSPRELRREMEQNGLRVVRHELYWGGLGALPGPAYAALMVPLQRQWWLGARVARRQLMVTAPGRGRDGGG